MGDTDPFYDSLAGNGETVRGTVQLHGLLTMCRSLADVHQHNPCQRYLLAVQVNLLYASL